ncbi:MAG: hypothetical protein Q9227_003238 [Pyrenula ochraceoflavens]
MDALLQSPESDEKYDVVERQKSSYNPMYSYVLPKGDSKHYSHQFADMYFLRLAKLKPSVEAIADSDWDDFEIAGEKAQRVERVLDVRQGQLCWVAGTVFIDMPLKPNILEDIAQDHWISGPPSRKSYYSSDSGFQVMLEDESGRLRLTGAMLQSTILVTGVIMAVLGTENANGDFEVLDIRLPDLPRQPQRWERDDAAQALNGKMNVDRANTEGNKVALVSGIGISGKNSDSLSLSLLTEYLLGEALSGEEQPSASQISRLIIAGCSLADEIASTLITPAQEPGRKAVQKKYGYDATAFNAAPITSLDEFLAELLPSLPITIMAGENDPANASLPQQPIHNAMFPRSRNYASSAPPAGDPNKQEPGWFDSVTNPWEGDVEGWRFMGNSGQPVNDIFKYVEFGGEDGQGTEGRLEVIESILRWRCAAPTAPDTLWCYPFQEKDQFVIEECPHLFFVGNQPKFDTAIVEGPMGQQVRLIAVPKFSETGEVVVVNTETLEDIQEATASEPLTLEQEYSMQKSWRHDSDKLTFIVCHPLQKINHSAVVKTGIDDTASTMVGDVNLFLSKPEDVVENGKDVGVVGELELMIAERDEQRKGYGRVALITFLHFIQRHEHTVLMEFSKGASHFTYFRAKIGQENHRSLGLFEGLGFVKTSEEPNYFGEWELRRKGFQRETLQEMMERHGIEAYCELPYQPPDRVAKSMKTNSTASG